MPKASLSKGTFVQIHPRRGLAVIERHGVGADLVFRIDEVLRNVYVKKAFVVTSGKTTVIVWPSQVWKVRHPKERKRRKR